MKDVGLFSLREPESDDHNLRSSERNGFVVHKYIFWFDIYNAFSPEVMNSFPPVGGTVPSISCDTRQNDRKLYNTKEVNKKK